MIFLTGEAVFLFDVEAKIRLEREDFRDERTDFSSSASAASLSEVSILTAGTFNLEAEVVDFLVDFEDPRGDFAPFESAEIRFCNEITKMIGSIKEIRMEMTASHQCFKNSS